MQLLFKQIIIPLIFIALLPVSSIYLAIIGTKSRDQFPDVWGSCSSWIIVLSFMCWAILFLKIPAKTFHGPTTSFGFTPSYKANGFLYYTASVIAYLLLNIYDDFKVSVLIYNNMPEILVNLNVLSLLFCLYLLWQGKTRPQSKENLPKAPLIFEFYRGMEIHPRLWGMDVKQLTNCRIGLMAWQIFVLAFWFTSYRQNGWQPGMAVTALLQTIYLAKFYWWETGYFNTLDIILDRAGFYICWGCLTFVPSLYTYTSYYLVAFQPDMGFSEALAIFSVGLAAIFTNYLIDYEKEVFNKSNGKRTFLCKNPRYIEAEYRDQRGLQKRRLLLSGFWGIARHLNYTFELLLALCWSLPGYKQGVFPFLYFIVLFILLIHRTFRDEEKCSKKYGEYWKKYCNTVKYRLVPYIF